MRAWKELYTRAIQFKTQFAMKPDAKVTQHVIGELYQDLADIIERIERLERENRPSP